MTKEELLKSLNDHQRAYVNLDLGDKATNGDYMLASYHLVPNGKRNILQAACEVASESSTGTNFPVKTETPYARLLNALVYEVDMESEMVKIAFPWRLFDRNGNIQNIMTYIAGNIFGM